MRTNDVFESQAFHVEFWLSREDENVVEHIVEPCDFSAHHFVDLCDFVFIGEVLEHFIASAHAREGIADFMSDFCREFAQVFESRSLCAFALRFVLCRHIGNMVADEFVLLDGEFELGNVEVTVIRVRRPFIRRCLDGVVTRLHLLDIAHGAALRMHIVFESEAGIFGIGCRL